MGADLDVWWDDSRETHIGQAISAVSTTAMWASYDTLCLTSISAAIIFLTCAAFRTMLPAWMPSAGWAFAMAAGALCAATFVAECTYRARRDLGSMIKPFDPAKTENFAKRIAKQVAADPHLAARWEGLLRHEEETGVPILKGDIRAFQNKAVDSPQSGIEQNTKVSDWRLV